MEDIICYCPNCQGQLLFEDMKNVNAAYSSEPLITEKLYCPQCEMLVDPVIAKVDTLGKGDPAYHDLAPDNPGRTMAGGANAGGSQRGDSSDEGATQWRTDPGDEERNTWRPKS
jgi:hypothetical protein